MENFSLSLKITWCYLTYRSLLLDEPDIFLDFVKEFISDKFYFHIYIIYDTINNFDSCPQAISFKT